MLNYVWKDIRICLCVKELSPSLYDDLCSMCQSCIVHVETLFMKVYSGYNKEYTPCRYKVSDNWISCSIEIFLEVCQICRSFVVLSVISTLRYLPFWMKITCRSVSCTLLFDLTTWYYCMGSLVKIFRDNATCFNFVMSHCKSIKL
jgi:hypothetical protein